VIEDRGSQVTFSALGQQAPLAEKESGIRFAKRKKITAILKPLSRSSPSAWAVATSIDVTKPGIDKAYGIGKLKDTLHLSLKGWSISGMPCFQAGTIILRNRQVLCRFLLKDQTILTWSSDNHRCLGNK